MSPREPRRHATADRRLAAALAVLLGVAVLSVTVATEAEPSVWARARDPSAHRDATILREADALLDEARRAERSGPLSRTARSLVLEQANSLLSARGAAERNPEILRRLARVHYERYELDGARNHLEASVRLLRVVLGAALPVSVRAESWNELAIALARLGAFDEEIAAYDQALAMEPQPEEQALLLANRAEAFMLRGELGIALAGYRAALKVTPGYAQPSYGVTTWWSLGVALDRSGDLEAALDQIRMARSYDPDDERLSSESWFFLPDYDRYWYGALGHWLRARSATARAERLSFYEQAIDDWRSYLRAARQGDLWAELGAHRLLQCERERARALAAPE